MTSLPPDQIDTPSDSGERLSPQQLVLLAFIGVIVLLTILGIILYINRPPAPVEISTPATIGISSTPVPSPSQTATITLTPTLRATFTPEPTGTLTSSPTSTTTPSPTLPPSLTPAIPIETNDPYSLNFWTPELATHLIDLLEAYPETLSDFSRGADNSGYFGAFRFALFAQREALLRFSTAPEARDWLWRQAFNLARTGDPRAGGTYAALITQELNSGRVSLSGLFSWGQERNPPVVVEVVPLEVPSGGLSNSVIKVSAGENGSSFFWLLQRPNGYSYYPLSDYFDFVNPSGVNYFVEDLIGPGSAVIGTFRTKVPGVLRYDLPDIFNLSVEPPIRLAFAPADPPEIGPDFTSYWQPMSSLEAEGDLEFITSVFPACPVAIRHRYLWNSQAFTFLDASYELNPDPALLSYCELVIDHSINVWGLEPTIQLMETLLPNWPPDSTVDGGSYPEDALDEWRFRLSIYTALLGDQTGALDYANSIIDNPATPFSQWLEPAQALLQVYQTQRDIYQACLPSIFCNPRLAFQSLVSAINAQEAPQILSILQEAGVSIRSNGFFDFDFDGRSERWVVLRHQPGSQLEFWILSPTESNIEAIFVSGLETDTPRVTYQEPLGEPPIVLIDPDIAFQFVQQGLNQHPAVVPATPTVIFSADRTAMELDRIEEFLLSGEDPAQAREDLLTLGNSTFFTCNFTQCPRYYYLIGLASELTNDEGSAIAAYLEVWRKFLDSPFATMARFKLAGPAIRPGPTITPTPTITRTATATQPRTATPTFTPTVTGTPPTSTVSPTVTPTVSGTPPTSTISPTVTPTVSGTPPTSTISPTVTETS